LTELLGQARQLIKIVEGSLRSASWRECGAVREEVMSVVVCRLKHGLILGNFAIDREGIDVLFKELDALPGNAAPTASPPRLLSCAFGR
jgi:hypothetical protein